MLEVPRRCEEGGAELKDSQGLGQKTATEVLFKKPGSVEHVIGFASFHE